LIGLARNDEEKGIKRAITVILVVSGNGWIEAYRLNRARKTMWCRWRGYFKTTLGWG
jgi:hypothetical protein